MESLKNTITTKASLNNIHFVEAISKVSIMLESFPSLNWRRYVYGFVNLISLSGQLKEKVHVMMSHDWPLGIAKHGNLQELMRFKSFLRKEVHA